MGFPEALCYLRVFRERVKVKGIVNRKYTERELSIFRKLTLIYGSVH